LTWSEFERIFRKKYLSKRYYDNKEKEFYELKMGSMTNEEYTSKFLELLRYARYLKEETTNIHIFICGLSTTFRDRIEFGERRSLEEAIWKLKHFYEQSKHIYETKLELKGINKDKGKWDKKLERPMETSNKENAASHKKFNASKRGHKF